MLTSFIFAAFRYSNSALDLCSDYSFWQTNSSICVPRKDLQDNKLAHASICKRESVNCRKMWSKTSNCRNSSNRVDCNANFFCELSNTCIPQGETYLI